MSIVHQVVELFTFVFCCRILLSSSLYVRPRVSHILLLQHILKRRSPEEGHSCRRGGVHRYVPKLVRRSNAVMVNILAICSSSCYGEQIPRRLLEGISLRDSSPSNHSSRRCFTWRSLACCTAARGGHLMVLKWARGNGCPWNSTTCCWAADGEVVS